MLFGLDFLGLAQYSHIATSNFPNGWALGVFSSTFGDSRPAVERLLRTGKPSAVRVHLMWKDLHNFRRADFPQIVKEAGGWRSLVETYPNVKWYFSGACEHKMNAKAANELSSKVLNVLPQGVIYVNTPMEGGEDIIGPNRINERHGAKAKKKRATDQFSFDGSSCVDADVETIKTKFNTDHIFFFWEPRFNGRWETNDMTPRPQRQGWPDAKLIRSVCALANNKGLLRELPKGWIYKSHSENHGNGDMRAEKPVMISPLKTSAISLKLSDGTAIAKLSYYGPFDGGGHRYYASKWGYELTETAQAAQGDPRVQVWAERRQIGLINPAFRAGTYRA